MTFPFRRPIGRGFANEDLRRNFGSVVWVGLDEEGMMGRGGEVGGDEEGKACQDQHQQHAAAQRRRPETTQHSGEGENAILGR